MNRREFLRTGLIGGIGLALAPLVAKLTQEKVTAQDFTTASFNVPSKPEWQEVTLKTWVKTNGDGFSINLVNNAPNTTATINGLSMWMDEWGE